MSRQTVSSEKPLPFVQIQARHSVAILTFPEAFAYPRLTRAVLAELAELLETVDRSSTFRGVVIAGNQRSFPTGAEISEVTAVEGFEARRLAETGQALFRGIERFPVPVVAAIRGFCLGGGLDLALACHGRVASYEACFGYPGTTLGLMTGWGGNERLPRVVGKSAALQVLLTGERIPATQALSMGLVDRLEPAVDLIETAACLVERLSERFRKSPASHGMPGWDRYV